MAPDQTMQGILSNCDFKRGLILQKHKLGDNTAVKSQKEKNAHCAPFEGAITGLKRV